MKYSKKLIVEAIRYWNRLLKKLNESQDKKSSNESLLENMEFDDGTLKRIQKLDKHCEPMSPGQVLDMLFLEIIRSLGEDAFIKLCNSISKFAQEYRQDMENNDEYALLDRRNAEHKTDFQDSDITVLEMYAREAEFVEGCMNIFLNNFNKKLLPKNIDLVTNKNDGPMMGFEYDYNGKRINRADKWKEFLASRSED